MPTDCISYTETNYFSSLVTDYLDQKESLRDFYNHFPSIENFKNQLEEKEFSFPEKSREILVNALEEQYLKFETSASTLENIQSISQTNTFTVTTGHQLNLFTGPLYFLYKIVSVINLTNQLKRHYPNHNFVPVYWMATEDHDFEEINFFNLKGKKFQWNNVDEKAGKSPVGQLSTKGLDEVFDLFSAEVGGGRDAAYVKNLFEKAYLNHDNLTDATLYLVNELFKDYGLVILDAQHRELKRLFIPFAERELSEGISYKSTIKKAEDLNEMGYDVQVNPREINLFYCKEGFRARIIEQEGHYFVNETSIQWSRAEILEELQYFPERFSPNVIMRSLYQEIILPNLCYIGGGGELAYWLELKDYFAAEKIPFPILLLRNSALIISPKQEEKCQKLNISAQELFLKQHELINRKVRQISAIEIDFSSQKAHLRRQFNQLYILAEQTDKTFLSAVKAQEVKQLKGLDKLEKRLLKAQKRKLKEEVNRITKLQNELFPNGNLQERYTNFSEIYLEYGKDLIPVLKENLNPLEPVFKILTFGKERGK